MSAGYSYDYPECTYDDCYCKRHWPNRSGGEELEVVQEDGSVTIYCETAIANNDDITGKCDYCHRWMECQVFHVDDDHQYCARCMDKANFAKQFSLIFEDGCSPFVVLPRVTKVFSLPPTMEPCEKCASTHMICNYITDGREVRLDHAGVLGFLEEDAQRIFRKLLKLDDHTDLSLQKTEQVKAGVIDFFEKRRQTKKDERTRRRIEQELLAEQRMATRKRLLIEVFPALADLSNEEFATRVPDSLARISTEEEHDHAKRLCNRGRDKVLSLDDTLSLIGLF